MPEGGAGAGGVFAGAPFVTAGVVSERSEVSAGAVVDGEAGRLATDSIIGAAGALGTDAARRNSKVATRTTPSKPSPSTTGRSVFAAREQRERFEAGFDKFIFLWAASLHGLFNSATYQKTDCEQTALAVPNQHILLISEKSASH